MLRFRGNASDAITKNNAMLQRLGVVKQQTANKAGSIGAQGAKRMLIASYVGIERPSGRLISKIRAEVIRPGAVGVGKIRGPGRTDPVYMRIQEVGGVITPKRASLLIFKYGGRLFKVPTVRLTAKRFFTLGFETTLPDVRRIASQGFTKIVTGKVI